MPILLTLCLILAWSLAAHAGTVNLAWNASPTSTSYRLYYGVSPGSYQTMLEAGPATSASVSGLLDGTRYYFAATALNTMGESGYSNEVNQLVGVPPQQAVAVNAAGPQYPAPDGTVYLADQWWTGAQDTYTVPNSIANTSEDPLYQSERHGVDFRYDIPVANGTYQVTLKFAELWWTANNRRLIDVFLEGSQVINNLDIHRQAGGRFRAYDRTFSTTVADSVLTVRFRADRNQATITAIKVVPQ